MLTFHTHQKIIIFIGALLFSPEGYSQKSSFVPGQIITNTDTIKCFVREQIVYSGQIEYKLHVNDAKSNKINSDEIIVLKVANDEYAQVTFNRKPHLMKKISLFDNPVTLYENSSVGSHPAIGPAGLGAAYTSVSSTFYIVKGVEVFKLDRGGYKKRLLEAMGDNKKIEERIRELKFSDLKFRLGALVTDYNIAMKFTPK